MSAVQAMTATDEALTEVIQAWLRLEVPDDGDLVHQIALMAMSLRADGATVEETCEWTRGQARSRLQHPSYGSSGRQLQLVGAVGHEGSEALMKRRRRGHAPTEVVTPNSSVHILQTEDELRDAVRCASKFDERTADMLKSRSRHYRTLVVSVDSVDAS